MREFLEHYSRYDPDLIRGFEGVPALTVDAFEKELGVTLPADYREFLLTMAGGCSDPESTYFGDPVVLFRRGRQYISFAYECVADQRTTRRPGRRNTKRERIRIGLEDGCTGCDPFLSVDTGQVSLSTQGFDGIWFESFREMLFALGFNWLARNGQEVRFVGPLRKNLGGQRHLVLTWDRRERDVVSRIAEAYGLTPCPEIPAPSLAFANQSTTLMLSNLFAAPATAAYELTLTSVDKAQLEHIVSRLERELLLSALRY